MERIFAINLGSTSTKVAYAEDGEMRFKDTIRHPTAETAGFETVLDQKDYRLEHVLDFMEGHGIEPGDLDALISRGGLSEPMNTGVYRVNEAYVGECLGGAWGIHAASAGPYIAFELTRGTDALPLTADTPAADEMEPLARYTGLPGTERTPTYQPLNNRAMARAYAESVGRRYEDMNLVVTMIGGGITTTAHRRGRMVDAQDGVIGDGTWSNNRCCGVPVGKLIDIIFDEGLDREGAFRRVNGEAGLLGYLGTMDIRRIEQRIRDGDARAEEVLDALCYQISKDIGAYATVLKGDVDAILCIGGGAHSEFMTSHIRERVEWIAPFVVMPGEREMESLLESARLALAGELPIQEFVPKEG